MLGVLALLCMSSVVYAVQEGDYSVMAITGTLVDTPECTINDNNQIDIDFGEDVIISRIDGLNYKNTPLVYHLECNSLAKNTLRMIVKGPPASFDKTLIGTDVEGLGIRVFLYDTVPIEQGTTIGFKYGEIVKLSVAPVLQNGITLRAQPFRGTGTMVIEYQ
ncbi:fimbrial protein [Enterobacter sp. 22325]|uniref:fimbrial protein n=1 Tax=Enterobacter sp. 22325 TaxID=3453911 RepID=UPI003F83D827